MNTFYVAAGSNYEELNKTAIALVELSRLPSIWTTDYFIVTPNSTHGDFNNWVTHNNSYLLIAKLDHIPNVIFTDQIREMFKVSKTIRIISKKFPHKIFGWKLEMPD